jgi:hypothetical protein
MRAYLPRWHKALTQQQGNAVTALRRRLATRHGTER